MQRAVTAIYRSSDVASLVQQELEQLGIGRHNITILPDASGTGSMTTSSGGADYAIERLHDLGLPDDDARTYQQALRNGDYVVSVEVDDDQHLDRVQEIMRRPEDAYDLDELDNQYADADYIPRQQAAYADTGSMSQSGGMGTGSGLGMGASAATGLGASASASGMDAQYNDDGTIKVVDEELSVGKRAVEAGRVRVRSYVREEPVSAEVDLRATRVFVERRPVDRPVGAGDLGMGERVIEARETVEEPVVAKQARVVEEIGLRQESEVQHQTIQDTVRKTEVEIEDTRTGDTSSLRGDGTDRERF